MEKYYPEFFNGYQIDLEDLVKDGIISPVVDNQKRKMDNVEISHTVKFFILPINYIEKFLS